MNHEKELNLIDPRKFPAWDFKVRVDGMDLPMISPLNAPALNPTPIPSQQKIDAELKRWPGLIVWFWRTLFGAPRLKREDLPTDGGFAHARMLCKIILCSAHDDLVDRMQGGQCAQVIEGYMACQEAWLQAASKMVRAQASEHLRMAQPSQQQVPDGFEPMIPGNVKFRDQHHPLVSGDRGVQQG